MTLKRDFSIKVEGLVDLQKALMELPSRATQRNVVRRVLLKAAEPIAEAMKQNSEHFRRTGTLEESIDVGTKLSNRQARIKKKDKRLGKDSSHVEVFAGAGSASSGYAHLKEFGDFNSAPDPFARPAFDGEKENALNTIKNDMWGEIKAAAERAAKKKLKKGKK